MFNQPKDQALPLATPNTESAMYLLLHERVRQVEREGYAPKYDDGHERGELAMAAAAYAAAGAQPFATLHAKVVSLWPVGWGEEPRGEDRIRSLVKAGALILAELERINREGQARSADWIENCQ